MSTSANRPVRARDAVADAVDGNWVDRWAPSAWRPFLRLSRADRPIGTWLLLLPCWWGLALAALAGGSFHGSDLWIFAGCGAGAWLMRGAGCTWNDLTDREYDARVERTRSRPLPSGQVSPRAALLWLIVQAVLAAAILFTFNNAAIVLGIMSLFPVIIYPFTKRITWWPQVFLGIAFNWGALLGWVAHAGGLGIPALILYASGIFWTLFYDTIYAYQDQRDDALIGIRSTARLFGSSGERWLMFFAVAMVCLFAVAVWAATSEVGWLSRSMAMAAPIAIGIHLLWQLARLDPGSPETCLGLFRANRNAGLLPLPFLFLATLL